MWGYSYHRHAICFRKLFSLGGSGASHAPQGRIQIEQGLIRNAPLIVTLRFNFDPCCCFLGFYGLMHPCLPPTICLFSPSGGVYDHHCFILDDVVYVSDEQVLCTDSLVDESTPRPICICPQRCCCHCTPISITDDVIVIIIVATIV